MDLVDTLTLILQLSGDIWFTSCAFMLPATVEQRGGPTQDPDLNVSGKTAVTWRNGTDPSVVYCGNCLQLPSLYESWKW